MTVPDLAITDRRHGCRVAAVLDGAVGALGSWVLLALIEGEEMHGKARSNGKERSSNESA